ncbi:MAG: hypothetical protein LBQ33_03855 [Oscillospiraceae bacterium]|jgi:hypothetical protein|nr:hypothetical protein [Oscillospiraceae bacterium]
MRISKKMLPFCILTACVLSVTGLSQRRSPAPQPSSTQTSAVTFRYLLREDAGELAVYVFEGAQMQRIAAFEAVIGDLPEADRQALRTGIAIRDAAQLQQTLEDYLP